MIYTQEVQNMCPDVYKRQDKNMAIDDMSLEELKAISPVFEEDIYDSISMETCVNKRRCV